MTLLSANFGALFEIQPQSGILAPGLQAIIDTPPGAVDETDGTVFGDSTSGVGGSGIDLTITREAQDAAIVTPGLTRKFDEFIRAGIGNFAFSFPIAGNKKDTTITPASSEFVLDPGLEAIYAGCGLGGSAGGSGQNYAPVPAVDVSCLVFDTSQVYALIDMQASLTMVFNVGGLGIQTANFSGKVDLLNSGGAAFPTFTYGQQDLVASPIVESVNNKFTPIAFRGFSEMTITIDNSIIDAADSNALDGIRSEQEGREIGMAFTIDTDSTDPTFDYDNLVATAAQIDDLSFQVGDLNAGSVPAISYAVLVGNVNIQDLTPAQPASSKANTLTAFGTGTIDGGEFSIEFN